MSAEPSECVSELWTRWQGHLINGLYPLGRYLGSSDHSGVFLTRSEARAPSQIAIKLVPADRAVAESLLPRWKRAGALAHPNLLRLHEWGGCQLEGSPYLYVVMDYADQTLAQLLQSRALTEVEAREMLVPVLDALAFLHGRDLVQGQLKPANILVQGDQLRLASDTIRRVGDRGPTAHARTPYDPPEALHEGAACAGDIWALGISLCEALTRHPPSTGVEHGDPVALPADLAPSFHDVVSRCLSPRPQHRPGVPELLRWAGGQAGSSAPAASVPPPAPEPPSPEPAGIVPTPVSPDTIRPTRADVPPEAPRIPVAAILGALLGVALISTGWHHFGKRAAPAAPSALARPAPGEPVSASGTIVRPGRIAPTPTQAPTPRGIRPLREVIPDVPLSARRTIRGHIKVWVRVSVDQDGSASAVLVNRAGPSRYFERLAQQAAKQWTFPPVGGSSRRLIEIRFDFSRDGTQARAVPLP